MRGRKPAIKVSKQKDDVIDLEAAKLIKVRKLKKNQPQDDKTLLLERFFDKKGIEVFDERLALEKPKLETGIIKNSSFKSIWGKKKTSHFLLKIAGRERPVRIDYHAQHVGGTVEEKIPYWIENAIAVPEDVVLILDGEGFSKEAKEYAIRRCNVDVAFTNGKTVKVFKNVSDSLEYIISLFDTVEIEPVA